MNGPLFSIVCAVHDQAKYIDAMVVSVEHQRFDAYELIVVDDGSTDGTPERLRHAAERWAAARRNRFEILRIPNCGQSAALEHGFARACGRYVALLDGDDVFHPWKLGRLRAAILTDPTAGMLVHPLDVLDEQGTRTGEMRPRGARMLHGDLRAQVRRDARIAVPGTSAITIRADVLRAILPMPTREFRTMADAYLPLAASLVAPVHVIDQPLAGYRMHDAGAHLASLRAPDGLERWLAIQRRIAGHLGLEDAMARNVTFARNAFALAKLTESWPAGLARYPHLARLTLADVAMPPMRRLPLLAAWTAMACAPRPLFARLWARYLTEAAGWSSTTR
ncbi:MAG TPA: glycosyltransferase [Gemmatimonadales bacterium]|nr:glycosyltransferase [Gemmatimonadales bacterium]